MINFLNQLWSAIGQVFTYYTLHDFLIVLGLLSVDFILVFSLRSHLQGPAKKIVLHLIGGFIPILTIITFQTYLIIMSGGKLILSQTSLQLVILYYFILMLDNKTQIILESLLALGMLGYFSTQKSISSVQLGLGIFGLIIVVLSSYYINANRKKILNNMYLYVFWMIIWGSSWWLILILGVHNGAIYQYLALLIKFIVLMTIVHHLNRFVRSALDRYLRIEDSSKKDFLTGIWNREAFNQEIEKAFQLFQLNQRPFHFLMFDIDNFKAFNDTYGHTTGDNVLKSATIQVQLTLEKTSLESKFYRLGGEEFGIIINNATVLEVTSLAKVLATNVKRHPIVYEGQILTLTISMGITVIKSADLEFDMIYQRADDALYYSKEHGKSAITIEDQLIEIK